MSAVLPGRKDDKGEFVDITGNRKVFLPEFFIDLQGKQLCKSMISF